MSIYNDIPVGLRVPSNLPLDAKLWVKSKSEIQSLGPSDNLAYTYYKGMRIHCADEKEIYEWMPVSEAVSLSLTALLSNDFTYPGNYPDINNVHYAGVVYNLFLIPQAWNIPAPPGLTNVGSGVQIYKGLNTNHEIRSVKTQVVQPDSTGNQMTGQASLSAIQGTNDITIKLDLSELKVPIQQTGIPEYYVHSGANAAIADGSIVRPYKTWDACRTAIIGSGSYYNPQYNGVRVIFQTSISSAEDLSIVNVIYRFDNNSMFIYTGSEDAVFDMDKIKIHNVSSDNSFEGIGTIRGIDKMIILRAGGNSPAQANEPKHHVAIKTGAKISLEVRYSETFISTYFEITSNGAGLPCYDGGGQTVYAMKKDTLPAIILADLLPADEGILSIKGHNYPVWQSFHVEPGGTLQIKSDINRAVYIEDSNLINYGNIIFSSPSHVYNGQTVRLVRYGEIDSGISGGNAIFRYTPSFDVSLIFIDSPYTYPTNSASSFNTALSGSISGFLLGSVNQGGFKSIIELKGYASNFIHNSSSPMTWNDYMHYNYFTYIVDLNIQSPIRKRVSISDIYITTDFRLHLLGGIQGIENSNFMMDIGQGALVLSPTKIANIFESTVVHDVYDIIKAVDFIVLYGRLYNTSAVTLEYTDSVDAINNGHLVKGMIFRTDEHLKIVL